MRIVFLDFDGVLNQGWGLPLPILIRRLNTLTKATSAKIVVHSSWRYGRTIDNLRTILDGWNVFAEVVGVAPVPDGSSVKDSGILQIPTKAAIQFLTVLPEEYEVELEQLWDYERAAAIQHWLNEQPHDSIESFVILDDHDFFAHLSANHVQTNASVGLTESQMKKAMEILKAPSKDMGAPSP